MNSAQDQGKEQARAKCDCPLCALGEAARRWREKSPALGHFHQAHLEVMKGLRALMDECIDKMEEKPAAEGEPRVTKIEVE
jgi:predicted transcriptional regulator